MTTITIQPAPTTFPIKPVNRRRRRNRGWPDPKPPLPADGDPESRCRRMRKAAQAHDANMCIGCLTGSPAL